MWSNIEARDLGSHEDEFEKMKAGEESFETIPEYKSSVEKMIQLLDYANEDSLALGYDQAINDFANGEGWMFLQGSWTLPSFLSANPDFLYYLGNSFLCMFFATVVVTSFTTAVIPLSDAILIARSLKEGYSYSIIRLGGTLGYAVMTICAGMYLKTRPQMQFVFAFFAYMILFCFCIGLKEERNGQIVINEVVQENEQNRIFKNRDVYIVLGLAFVSQMGLSFYTGFIGPYILEKGYTQSTIGVINSISALSEVPVLFYINRMLRKHGTIKILFLSCFLMGIRILLPIRSGIIGIVLAQLLQGVTYMTMYYSCAVYISTCVYEKYQTKGQSILNVVQLGLGAIVGNLVGGKLIRLLGYEKGYLLMAGITTLMTICALIVYFWKNREQRNGGDVCEI